jgi:hypothetical protein
VAGYRVYRDGALMTTVTGTSWTDTAVTPGSTYSYTVTAFDAAGNAAPSAAVSATVPAAQPAAPPATTTPPSGSTPPPAATGPPPANPGPAPVPPAIPVDSTKPAVRLLAPAGRSHLRRSVVVRAAATDDTGVARIELWIDGRLRRTVGGDRIAWRWGLGRIRPGRHLVVVRAYDAAGNSGIGSARVRVLRAT